MYRLFILSILILFNVKQINCAFNWDNLVVPTINFINYTTGEYERNFSKYFHYNTLSINTAILKNTAPTLSSLEEEILRNKTLEDNKMGHCIFDDFFDMDTFKMKPKIVNEFLVQLSDMCNTRVKKTKELFQKKANMNSDQIKEQYIQIKKDCDVHIEEFSIQILRVYKDEVLLTAAHHYDLRPKDEARQKYEEYITKQFTKIGYEFLPIIEKYYTLCSDKYYTHFGVQPQCDLNTGDEAAEMEQFEQKVQNTTASYNNKDKVTN